MLSAGFLPESPSSAQPDYVDDVCILLLSNSPNRRNSTAQDRVTVRAKEYRCIDRWWAQERALSGNSSFFVRCVQWPHLVGTRPLHLTMSLVKINDMLHSNYPYLLNWILITTELLSDEIVATNGIVYRLCILKHSTVILIIYKIYAFEIHPVFFSGAPCSITRDSQTLLIPFLNFQNCAWKKFFKFIFSTFNWHGEVFDLILCFRY